jgi:hypothetical protein
MLIYYFILYIFALSILHKNYKKQSIIENIIGSIVHGYFSYKPALLCSGECSGFEWSVYDNRRAKVTMGTPVSREQHGQ